MKKLCWIPVVCLLGPGQVGKSTLCRQLAPERSYLTFDDHTMLTAAKNDPPGFIQSLPEFVRLDEIQRVPELLFAIKAEVDRDRKPGRFLLTGSANLLLLPKVKESLAGRIEMLHLHPLTETEKEKEKDGKGLKRLVNQAGHHFKGGALIYCGNNAIPLKTEHCIATPRNWLWR